MPETKVPMTLREHFLEDPFFSSGWQQLGTSSSSVMEKSSSIQEESSSIQKRSSSEERSNSSEKEMSSSSEKERSSSSQEEGKRGAKGLRSLLLPRRWMLPRLLEDAKLSAEGEDSQLLGRREDEAGLELSLDTTGYRPEELKVKVEGGELCVEGRHEERSQAGHVMVSRQFQRRYGLPQGARREGVESNLSQDGVMVIRVPKERRIEEVGAGERIPVEHVGSVEGIGEIGDKQETSGRGRRHGRVDDFQGAGEMQGRRRSLSKAGRERSVSVVREERSRHREERSCDRKERRARNERSCDRERSREGSGERKDLTIPTIMRQPFLDDPFFKNTIASIESSRGDFFRQARQSFEDNLRQMESRMTGSLALEDSSLLSPTHWVHHGIFDDDFHSVLKTDSQDCSTIRQVEDETKLEVHLDTSGYRPDELRVEVEGGLVRVEGKHEERSQAGQVMVSRQFQRRYGLPQGAREEEVVSSLSKDGVLVVTAPKQRLHQGTEGRTVNIAIS